MSWLRNLIGLWIVLVVIAGVAVFYNAFSWLVDRILALPPIPPAPLNAYFFIAAFSITVGLFWVLWAASYLHFIGRGSSVAFWSLGLRPTEQLVTTGPYAYTRNPMLLGLLFLLLSLALLTRSVTALALLPIITLVGLEYMRAYEEPVLRQRFGREYSEYRRAVPALFPRPGR